MITIDGLYEGKDHNLDSLFEYFHPEYSHDETMDLFSLNLLESSDYLLLSGKESFLGFKTYWKDRYLIPETTEIRRQLSIRMNQINKIVVSDKINQDDLIGWENTEIIRISDTNKRLIEIKEQSGNDVLILGGRTLWNSLIEYELIDMIHFMVFPLMAYTGVPILTSPKKAYLKLVDSQTWKDSGIVRISYKIEYEKDIKF
jgi:dihydrofolate reductase